MASDRQDEGDAGEGLDIDPEVVKRELFTAWTAIHSDPTEQRFEAEWAALTSTTLQSGGSPGDTTARAPASEDQDPIVIKRRMFEEWRALHPQGTRAQFEAEWDAIT